jgi:hypothetical protein
MTEALGEGLLEAQKKTSPYFVKRVEDVALRLQDVTSS